MVFIYSSNEVVSMGRVDENHLKRYVLKCLGKSISMLSPKAKWHRLTSGILKKTIYGFYPGSTKTHGSALIMLPFYNCSDVNFISIQVGLENKPQANYGKTLVNIELEGIPVERFQLGGKSVNKSLKIPITRHSHMKNRIKLEIKFQKDEKLVKGHIYKVHLDK